MSRPPALVPALLTLMFGTASAQDAETFRQYQFAPGDNGQKLVLRELRMPAVGPGEVMIRVRATSLNRRDIYILNSQRTELAGNVPLSDGAGEVISVGDGVTEFAVGDRVAGTFFDDWRDGAQSEVGISKARGGGAFDGMLSEIVVSDQYDLVHIPRHLSYAEAATLPCAAVTAWNGLFKRGNLQAGDYVLLEGTGGVSTLGLQLAAAAGAKPIVTSSSDEKLAKARELGAVGTVNYRENENWQVAVREITGGAGVDHVLEIGGRDTLPKALEALAYEGNVALIGGLTGTAPPIPVDAINWIGASVTGIYVGSRADFIAMNSFITEHALRPYVDRVFSFDKAPDAFDLMENGSFMGKIVILLE